jgi:hypothetical protein
MDELTLLRELDDDPPALAPEARSAARLRLRREMARGDRPSSKRVRGVVAVAVAAAAVAGVIALDDDRERSGRAPAAATELASARAREVLHLAARRSLVDVPAAAVPRGEQYIYLREVLEERPVDGDGKPRTFVDELWYSVDGTKPSRVSELGRSWMEPPRAQAGVWPPRGYEELAKMPTDPAELRRTLRGGEEAADYETEYTGLFFMLAGRSLMPPGLQAAAFRALAQIPGVDVIDDAVNLRGRRGIGITRPERAGFEAMLILDRDTYQYLGTRTIHLSNEGEKVVQLTARVEEGIVDRIGERPPGG